MTRLAALLFAIALTAAAPAARAQALVDPTRPPSESVARAAAAAAHPPASVQTVKTSPAGPVALVGGQIVKVGDALGEDRVIRITDSELVLRRPGGATEVVKLYPRVDKRAVLHAPLPNVGDAPSAMLRAGE